jgi:hypothetical protein
MVSARKFHQHIKQNNLNTRIIIIIINITQNHFYFGVYLDYKYLCQKKKLIHSSVFLPQRKVFIKNCNSSADNLRQGEKDSRITQQHKQNTETD